ncbi:isoleucine--tRNA ligase [Chelatococcus asaccharovorans]|uniref:isoleucine--tRNA ligase n=1 Tax=Chelatococcus asaccharovorans TaxID=28210 RepID=UPI00224C64C8|nr:isoleucine--tRNA ligase [Chelatococcus asaccharovorans]CAH1668932.1 isoleucine--tRNA ligase [Chelatococcus asaccharovorans]CAH1679614.1 isoleucine--tRNA ligase [Chelatococcus asaccharovorans]
MTDSPVSPADTASSSAQRDYSETLFLPQTDFPMRAGLPQREPDLLERWNRIGLYKKLRAVGRDRKRFVLHDGPPYANGNIHIGHALNKILKDLVTRSQQMLDHDANYVPGWDCHGLPIEWKVEEQYRAKGRDKDDVPIIEFRRECRAFAQHWLDVQREEFKRLGVEGDWGHPYATMTFDAEAQIAREVMKFAESGQLYRGSKPVMWSIVERTALAEAEVEYQEHTSQTIFVKFPVITSTDAALVGAAVVIWTTTPWTIPANRAIAFSKSITYGLYEVTAAPDGNWAKAGDRYILADKLAEDIFRAAKVEAYERRREIPAAVLAGMHAAHPLRGQGYDFDVPVVAADYVTDDAGTGFVHTAPGHGADDYITFINNRAIFERAGTPIVPHTVGPDGAYYDHVPLFAGARVLDDKGKEGDANKRVIDALAAANALIARGRLKHQYPHSWRSKAPLIFRNTPQWFIAMDKDIAGPGDTLRHRALTAIAATEWVPETGENRITGMIQNRPDWVISRQRAWGVPIAIFMREDAAGNVIDLAPGPGFKANKELADRVGAAFVAEGADAWFAADPRRFLDGLVDNPADWTPVNDILDVWFESGSTHAFTLEVRPELKARRAVDGGHDTVMYLEGSDQHRGWFHSSLLESCGTRGRAPFDIVLTHGFTLDEHGRKMSKSLGNTVAPQDVIRTAGADILRLWTASVDYSDDQRIGPEIIKSVVDHYRKLRNTIRWMLGTLHHFRGHDIVQASEMPELEQFILHRLTELDEEVRKAYAAFDYKRVVAALSVFMTSDLSAFYFDVRKDALYCDPAHSLTRRSALTVIDQVFRCVTTWLAPILVFTTEEAWLARFPSEEGSVHLELFPQIPPDWRDNGLKAKWDKIRRVRRVITGALEVERAQKRIGSSLDAAPIVFIEDAELMAALKGIDLAEIAITSAIQVIAGVGPADGFRLDDVASVVVVPGLAAGRKCARSWKISPEVGSDPDYPDVTPRDAEALRVWDAAHKHA